VNKRLLGFDRKQGKAFLLDQLSVENCGIYVEQNVNGLEIWNHLAKMESGEVEHQKHGSTPAAVKK
jgi:hypothetical protein